MRYINAGTSKYVTALVTFCFSMAWAAKTHAYHPAVEALRKCAGVRGCPATVPSDFVLTPSGWFHPSCVVPILEDEVYNLMSGEASRSGGTTRIAPPCGHLPYDAQGTTYSPTARSTQKSPPPSIAHDYLADVHNGVSVSPVSIITATWTVPPAPPSDGATLYYFPAVRNWSPNGLIIQPVLEYNGASDNTPGWAIESWDCCDAQGNILKSASVVPVSPGEVINGAAVGSSCNATTGVCSTWTVQTGTLTRNLWSIGVVTNNPDAFGTGPNEVLAGAFEVWGVDTCSQLAYPRVHFSDVSVADINGRGLSPAAMNWVDNDWNTWPGHVPECWATAGHASGPSTTSVDISWSTCGAPPFLAIESLLLR
jgi:hypothetical protein